MAKNVFVDAHFPELRGPAMYKTGRGTGSNPKVAIGRAMAALLKQVSGKRFSCIKATITITEATKETSDVIES